MHIIHLKPIWRVWYGVVLDIKLRTSFTLNLYGMCGIGHQQLMQGHCGSK